MSRVLILVLERGGVLGSLLVLLCFLYLYGGGDVDGGVGLSVGLNMSVAVGLVVETP